MGRGQFFRRCGDCLRPGAAAGGGGAGSQHGNHCGRRPGRRHCLHERFRRSIGVSGWAGGPGRGAFGDGLRRPNNAYPVHPCRCGDLCADSADDTGGLSPNCSAKVYTGQVIRRYSLIVGRKRINLSGNSGISDATCDKMTETKTLSLPGGYSLPVKLEIETLRPYRTVEVQVSQTLAEDALCSYARQAALSEMIAGEILGQTPALREESGLY